MPLVSVRLPNRDGLQGGCIEVEVAEQGLLRSTSPDVGFQYGRPVVRDGLSLESRSYVDRLANRHC